MRPPVTIHWRGMAGQFLTNGAILAVFWLITLVVATFQLDSKIMAFDQALEVMVKATRERDAVVKADVFRSVAAAADTAPTTTNRLNLALALATPGHPSSNPAEAQRRLGELLSRDNALLPDERALALTSRLERLRARDGHDAPHARRNSRLARDAEHQDLSRVAHMRAAAEFLRPHRDLDHAHRRAVLLAEERHRAAGHRLGVRLLPRAHVAVLPDAFVHPPLHLLELRGRERAMVREVEAQAVRIHDAAGLVHMVAQQAAERGMQQVRSRVVAHDVAAPRRRHARHRGRV